MKTQGYEVKKFSGPTKRYCQALNLKDDKDLVHPTFRVIRQSCRAYNLSLK